MRRATNCLLVDPKGNVLLSMKKRGFGVGNWNGAGGKLQDGETFEQAAVREVHEEIGVIVEEKDLEKVAEMNYVNDDPNWGMFVTIYIARKWKGEPIETEEMRPQWFRPDEIPYDHAWEDFQHWCPKVLAGEKIKGEFVYKSDGKTLDHFDLSATQAPFDMFY